MSVGLLLLIILILAVWGGGFWYGPASVRGNNAMHVILVVLVIFVLLHLLGVRIR